MEAANRVVLNPARSTTFLNYNQMIQVASGARKIVDAINIQSLMICAPVLTQIFFVQI